VYNYSDDLKISKFSDQQDKQTISSRFLSFFSQEFCCPHDHIRKTLWFQS